MFNHLQSMFLGIVGIVKSVDWSTNTGTSWAKEFCRSVCRSCHYLFDWFVLYGPSNFIIVDNSISQPPKQIGTPLKHKFENKIKIHVCNSFHFAFVNGIFISLYVLLLERKYMKLIKTTHSNIGQVKSYSMLTYLSA